MFDTRLLSVFLYTRNNRTYVIYLWSQGWYLELLACWSSSAFADSWILPTIQVYFSLDSCSSSHCVGWSTISFWHAGLHYACNLSYPLEWPFSMSSLLHLMQPETWSRNLYESYRAILQYLSKAMLCFTRDKSLYFRIILGTLQKNPAKCSFKSKVKLFKWKVYYTVRFIREYYSPKWYIKRAFNNSFVYALLSLWAIYQQS